MVPIYDLLEEVVPDYTLGKTKIMDMKETPYKRSTDRIRLGDYQFLFLKGTLYSGLDQRRYAYRYRRVSNIRVSQRDGLYKTKRG